MKLFHLLILPYLMLSHTYLLNAEIDPWKAEEYFQNSSSQKNAASDLLKFVLIKETDNILDVGCGDGKITAEIANKLSKGSITGVDLSPSMIAFAKASFPNLIFKIKDATDLDFNSEFDSVFSFTTLQWIQNHKAFLQGAYQALKPSGTLAITMPMGLPDPLEQAVLEIIALPKWSSYFQSFSTGWNFVKQEEYEKLLSSQKFTLSRVAVIPQKDIFPSKEIFENFIKQWFPYLRALPESLKKEFLTEVTDRFLELETPFPNGEIHFKIRRLEVIAVKSA